MRKNLITGIPLFFFFINHAQTIGGNNVFNFLNLPNTPQLTGLGGVNITNQSNDIGLVFNNPALIRPSMHTQANLVFNVLYAGIKNYHLIAGFHHEKLQTDFTFGVNYFHYGSITETDASGNILGTLRPVDYLIQLSAGRKYAEKWHYGLSLKFIRSNYGQYRSSGVAADAGLTYTDSAYLIQAGLVIKNMGAQLSAYSGTAADDLPFDIQAGISKRLEKAPIQFSLTASHLNRFDISYNDTLYSSNGSGARQKKISFDKIFRHIILATQIYIGDKVEVSVGYNYLRRKELNIGNSGNGLDGFSLGLGVLFKKIQIRYARSYYQNNTSYHQFGLNLKMNEYLNRGRPASRLSSPMSPSLK